LLGRYTEAFLGKSPEAYIRDILDPKKWGGGIELAMLSQYYSTEIVAFDVQTLR
jgi:ubiquitin thioesterase OTU1